MNLTLAHRILIAAAVVLSALFAVYEIYLYARSRDAMALVLAGVSLAAGLSLAFYLRWFLRKARTRAGGP